MPFIILDTSQFFITFLEISQGVLFVGREIVSLFEKDHFESFRMTILHSWLPLQITYEHFFHALILALFKCQKQ